MAFPDMGSERAFTSQDVESLTLLSSWVATERMDRDTAVEIMRSLGQTASRLADWQVDTLLRVLAESDEELDMDELADAIDEILPGLEKLLIYSWRRHLASVMGRGLSGLDDSEPDAAVGTVGFADIAGFTRLIRAMNDEDLAELVHTFETGAADIVSGAGARLVKTLGDEVMFVTADAPTAARVAFAIHELTSPGPEPLQVRIGMATGGLVSRMGDYYGRTVNRASRMTAIARPGVTLIDVPTEEALRDTQEPYAIRHLTPRRLRGLGMTRVSSLAPKPEPKKPEPKKPERSGPR
jgi:adenylate cyclase